MLENDQELAESRAREEKTPTDNRTASLEITLGELSDNLRVQGQILDNLQQGLAENNVAVGVTQGPGSCRLSDDSVTSRTWTCLVTQLASIRVRHVPAGADHAVLASSNRRSLPVTGG